MKHIVIDPGMLPLAELKETFNSFVKTNKLTLITEERRKEQVLQVKFNVEILYYENFKNLSNKHLNKDYQAKYNFVLKQVLSDQRTFLIAERVNRIFAWNSLFSITSTIEKIIFNSLCFFQENDIDYMLFQATPHNLPNWVLAKTAELIGVSVRMIQSSPLPWRFWIVEGLDVQKPVFPNNIPVADFDFDLLNRYIKLNQADYNQALPEYEKKRLDSRKGKLWSWKKEIKDAARHPKFAVNLPTKRKLFKLYDALSIQPNLDRKYLIFFLHFQPERTSLPEGLEFSNQWIIIRMISETLPEGWTLIVKEHPSVYMNYFDFRYRSSKFYNDIAALENVELAKLNFDTFDLIDKCEGIVTITGTVGVQALIRNKPVLVFGVGSYRNLKNVYPIKSLTDLNNTFIVIEENKTSEIDLEGLQKINTLSINGIHIENYKTEMNFYNSSYRIQGHIKLIKMILDQ